MSDVQGFRGAAMGKAEIRQFGICNAIFRIAEGNLAVRIEQLRTRMAMYPSLIFSQVALEPLFVMLLWERASHPQLLAWLGMMYVIHSVEMIQLFRHRDELQTVNQCRWWNKHFTIFALLVGAMWGMAVMLFFPDDLAYQSLLICVMVGLVAGGVTMNPVHPPALYAYLLGVLIPMIGRIAWENDALHWLLVAMLLLFSAVIVMAGRELNKTFMLSLNQRFENSELLKQVSEQKKELEQAHSRLELVNAALQDDSAKLELLVQDRTSELRQRTEEVEVIKQTTILALSSLAETRDNETGYHILRTQNYVLSLASRLRDHSRFKSYLTNENIELLYKLAPLHDIGKVGIPDRILLKPGKLTPEEFEIMKTHAALGGNAIAAAENSLNIKSVFLQVAREIALGHHEKWDGSGYPLGVSGDDIPIPARLMALADVYDALISRRVYKKAMRHEDVVNLIVEGRGKHFDPDIVDAFIAIQHEFVAIAEKYSDLEVEPENRLAA